MRITIEEVLKAYEFTRCDVTSGKFNAITASWYCLCPITSLYFYKTQEEFTENTYKNFCFNGGADSKEFNDWLKESGYGLYGEDTFTRGFVMGFDGIKTGVYHNCNSNEAKEGYRNGKEIRQYFVNKGDLRYG